VRLAAPNLLSAALVVVYGMHHAGGNWMGARSNELSLHPMLCWEEVVTFQSIAFRKIMTRYSPLLEKIAKIGFKTTRLVYLPFQILFRKNRTPNINHSIILTFGVFILLFLSYVFGV
jgi:hypothetical protein